MKRTKTPIKSEEKLSDQMKRHAAKPVAKRPEYEGNAETIISTGSTLLDLAISGGRIKGGGIPGGILIEVFGPSSTGKTVLLCEIAGAVQRQGGQVMFQDPEGRLNKQFASIFDLDTDTMDYDMPNTVPEVFKQVRDWSPTPEGKIHGVFTDSLAALSTDLELTGKDGDKMGMRRAKEFSEECRKTCRVLTKQNHLMVCSNQVRQSGEQYGPKYRSPGGESIGFYASLRLRTSSPSKLKEEKKIKGKEVTRVYGIKTDVEVFKSSVWKPYGVAPIYIIFNYGIDDIRGNLQFIKTMTGSSTYVLGDDKLGQSMNEAIACVESAKLEKDLRDETINLWESIEAQFEQSRKPKRR